MHFRQALNGLSGAGAAAAATSSGDVYDHLEVTELLGSGTFGKVFKGEWVSEMSNTPQPQPPQTFPALSALTIVHIESTCP